MGIYNADDPIGCKQVAEFIVGHCVGDCSIRGSERDELSKIVVAVVKYFAAWFGGGFERSVRGIGVGGDLVEGLDEG